MSLAQESVYRDDQDFSDAEDKTSDDSISLNQSEQELQELQDTACKSDSSDNHESSVWPYFNKNTKDKPGISVCKICKTEFSKSSSTSILARYLTIHSIVALKQGKKPLNLNLHSKIEQQE
ncbi:29120_t:CDS:1 [Gigaspora margarita]|uniref:29120_t:CDS:1 n=1 Tax=Gigaspora margarita TaxID=4874 RepID=A0ABN7WG39_GIGMA|nr:29120_t:CDS:1 [Gigaspora margarita]